MVYYIDIEGSAMRTVKRISSISLNFCEEGMSRIALAIRFVLFMRHGHDLLGESSKTFPINVKCVAEDQVHLYSQSVLS